MLMRQWVDEEESHKSASSDLHDIVLVDYDPRQEHPQPLQMHQQFQTAALQLLGQSVTAIQHLSLWRQHLSYHPVITCITGMFILLIWTSLLPLVALGYPVFQCVQLVAHPQHQQRSQEHVENLQFWLEYWTLITPTLLAFIYIVDPLVAHWLPLYSLSKALFILACAIPETRLLKRTYRQLSRLKNMKIILNQLEHTQE